MPHKKHIPPHEKWKPEGINGKEHHLPPHERLDILEHALGHWVAVIFEIAELIEMEEPDRPPPLPPHLSSARTTPKSKPPHERLGTIETQIDWLVKAIMEISKKMNAEIPAPPRNYISEVRSEVRRKGLLEDPAEDEDTN